MKLRTLFLTAAAALCLSVSTFAQGVTVSLDGNTVSFPNQQPVVVEGRTLIPLRGVFDNMGYTISWNGNTKTVTLSKGSDTIVINIGESCYYLNGNRNAIDVPAQIINGSTMLPLRAIADATGANVTWDNNTKVAAIVTGGAQPSSSTAPAADSASELDFLAKYQSILSEYSQNTQKFMQIYSDFNSSDIDSIEDVNKVADDFRDVYNASVDAKNKFEALNCPSAYKELNNATIAYIDSLANIAKLVPDLADGNITLEDYNKKVDSYGADMITKQKALFDALGKIQG